MKDQRNRFIDAGVTTPLIDSDQSAVFCKSRIMHKLKKSIPQRQKLLRLDYGVLKDESKKENIQ